VVERYVPDRYRRVFASALSGGLAGIVPGLLLAIAVAPRSLGFVLGPTLGAAYSVSVRPTREMTLDHALGAAALAVPAWLMVQVTALPLLGGDPPAWTPSGVDAFGDVLVVWVTAGALFGATLPLVASVVDARLPAGSEDRVPDEKTRIVVLGGGFVGFTVARRLEELFGPDPTVSLTLVSDTSTVLFTPMLPEVAGGSLDPSTIASPLRTSLRRTRVIRARATAIDHDNRSVVLRPAGRQTGASWAAVDGGERTGDPSREDGEEIADGTETVSYNHLVLAVGSVPAYHGLTDVADVAFEFRTLGDAVAIRDHVVDCLERADHTDDPDLRQELVTFVVAGAGFAGAELAGALNDLVRGMLVDYPDIPRKDVRVVAVHAGERILPELDESLAVYALERMSERGVEFVLDTRVTGATPTSVALSTDENLNARTLVWTAGVRPNPLVSAADLPTEPPGAVAVDDHLNVRERKGLWAAGDCAAVTDAATGERRPPTAQHAVQDARTLARNLHAAVTGDDLVPATARSRGSLAVIGHQVACAELGDRQFSGLVAWFMWRAVYLRKLPGTERKIRVLVSWLLELFFPRDVVPLNEKEYQVSDVEHPDQEVSSDEVR
jgi:NADH dehydrogenase